MWIVAYSSGEIADRFEIDKRWYLPKIWTHIKLLLSYPIMYKGNFSYSIAVTKNPKITKSWDASANLEELNLWPFKDWSFAITV